MRSPLRAVRQAPCNIIQCRYNMGIILYTAPPLVKKMNKYKSLKGHKIFSEKLPAQGARQANRKNAPVRQIILQAPQSLLHGTYASAAYPKLKPSWPSRNASISFSGGRERSLCEGVLLLARGPGSGCGEESRAV